MIQTLTCFIALSSYVYFIDGTSESRFEADTRACNWEPWVPAYDAIFQETEKILEKSNIHVADIDGMYRHVNHWAETWREVNDENPLTRIRKWALALLDASNGLQTRDCFDICTYVLAKNCCKSGRQQNACNPKSRTQSFIKSILDARVFPMIARCQTSLMSNAIELNTTLIDPVLYAQVSAITELMTSYKPGKFDSIEKIALTAPKPFFSTRASIKPSSTGFFENLFHVMIGLEKLIGETGLESALKDSDFGLSTGFIFFERLISTPCLRFIELMRTAMDPTLYYGGIIDLSNSKFQLEDISQDYRVRYFKLLQRFHACVWLNNHETYEIDWAKLIREFFFSNRP